MKKMILALVTLASVTTFAYDPQFSQEVAICKGKMDGKTYSFTIYRDVTDIRKSTIIQQNSGSHGSFLFSGAVTERVGNVLETKHQKLKISFDLASEDVQKKTFSGQWDDSVKLTCKLILPVID